MTIIRKPIQSEYLFEGSEAVLADGAMVDSGWLDMTEFGKFTLDIQASAGGFEVTFYGSNVDGGGGIDSPPASTIIELPFVAGTLPVSKRYTRVTVNNITGGNLTDVYFSIKGQIGDADGNLAMPLNILPNITSPATLSKSVLIGQDTNGAFRNALVNQGGALVNADFFSEVALGNIPGYGINTKVGRNSDVDAGGTEDLIASGGNYSGQPVGFTPEPVLVVSSSALDTALGTGANAIRIIGLKTPTSTEYEIEDIPLNGLAGSVSNESWWRVIESQVLTAGSVNENQGVITISGNVTPAVVFGTIQAGFNQSYDGVITVPAGKTMIVKRVRMAINRKNGSPGSARVTLQLRPPGSVYLGVRVFEMQTGAALGYDVLGGRLIPEGTDMKIQITQVSDNNSQFEGAVEYLLIDN